MSYSNTIVGDEKYRILLSRLDLCAVCSMDEAKRICDDYKRNLHQMNKSGSDDIKVLCGDYEKKFCNEIELCTKFNREAIEEIYDIYRKTLKLEINLYIQYNPREINESCEENEKYITLGSRKCYEYISELTSALYEYRDSIIK